jgi:methanogenic corrinoid protein MtbC1
MAGPRHAWANAFDSSGRQPDPKRYGVDSVDPERAGSDCDARTDSLERIIEADIIPRLMLVHRSRREGADAESAARYIPTAEDVARLMKLVLRGDCAAASAYVASLRAEGMSLDAMFLELFAPVARRLGVAWEEDELSFVDVTVGLSGLQQLLHEFSPAPSESEKGGGTAALLVPAPGEQHTFGLFVVMEFFRRSGWEVWGGPPMAVAELCRTVRTNWFAVVGFSLSREGLLDELASAIQAVRAASRNRFLTVMVGGRVFAERPELAARVGADATADDARRAVFEAETLSGLSGGRIAQRR